MDVTDWKSGQRQDSNELNLEEIEEDTTRKENVLSGWGSLNNVVVGKQVSSKHAILKYSLKGKKKKKKTKKVSNYKESKINRHGIINSGAFPTKVINQMFLD